MTAANITGLAMLLARNSQIVIPTEHRDIYPMFNNLLPGDFRSLIKLAKRYTVEEEKIATREDEPITSVYYVIRGHFFAEKKGIKFPVEMSTFFGEAAFLLDTPSAATSTLPVGTEVLEWDVDTLRRVAAKKPRVKLAFEAATSRDLARKIVYSVPVKHS